jgi:DNA-binding CsgD family transcriptional regulator
MIALELANIAAAAAVLPRAGQPLTAREIEILMNVALGHSAPQIARDLGIATPTVKAHLAHIYKKLSVADRAAAVSEGLLQGLISAEALREALDAAR